jgi:hypothetical protein
VVHQNLRRLNQVKRHGQGTSESAYQIEGWRLEGLGDLWDDLGRRERIGSEHKGAHSQYGKLAWSGR